VSGLKKTGLGRGFDTLIPQNFDNSLLLNEDERIQKVAIKDVVPNEKQPRRQFEEAALDGLAASIKAHGILQPLVVAPIKGQKYQIVAGERRWRAAAKAGLTTVPVIIRTLKELEQLEIAIVENVQRVDLSPLEQAMSIERLHQEFSTPYEQIAKRLGKASSTVNNIVRLLQLPSAAQQALSERKISEGHARAILALKQMPKQQEELLKLILAHGWSVRQAERYVTSHKEGIQDKKLVQERVHLETPATKALSKRLGKPVHIRRMAKGGKLEITFDSDKDLQASIEKLS
jgi:ParB family chromosome partitioning protein